MITLPVSLGRRKQTAAAQLRELGKSPEEALKMLGEVVAPAKKGRALDFRKAGWSPQQILVLFELAALCALDEMQSGRLPASPDSIIRVALDYADVREDRLIDEMRPDYKRGKKVRESGAMAHGSLGSKYRKAEEFRAIGRKLARASSLTKTEQHRRIAKTFSERSGKQVSYKTVERYLKKFPVPLPILEEALSRLRLKKLGQTGVVHVKRV
jgi:hypothetical protein